MPVFHIDKNEEEVNKTLAEFICNDIAARLADKELYTLALTGGSTPRKLYERLSAEYANKIDWSRVLVFIGDERCVPFKDERSNARMIYEKLLQHVPVKDAHIFMMRTDVSAEKSAEAYNKILHTYFNHQSSSFDMFLLGMGEDGHTLSLFPGKEENNEKNAWCIPVFHDGEGIHRITLTTPVVNASAITVFLVMGKNKAEAVSQVIKGKYEPDKLPAQLITPQNNVLHWFLDKAAAELLADPTAALQP